MTWPADGLPRYKASVFSEGYGNGSTVAKLIGYVYDRGHCFKPVAEIKHKDEGEARRMAEEAVAVLNAGGTLTAEQLGETPHGRSRYRRLGCRCAVCRAAESEGKRGQYARRQATA